MKRTYKKIKDIPLIDWNPIIQDGKDPYLYVYESEEETETGIPFQLVYFPDRIHNSNIYVKYPDNPFFIELPHISMNSGGGSYGTGIDPYSGCEIDVIIKGENAVIRSSRHIQFFKHTGDVNKVYHEYYLEIPPVYKSEYVLDISSLNIFDKYQYLLIARPVHNYEYGKVKAYFVNENGQHIELDISDFSRARDGGTTWIDLICPWNPITQDQDNISFKLFVPTPFKEERICKLNDEVVQLIKSKKVENQYVNELGDKLCKAVNLLTEEDIKYMV
jgi:hypothetical protein